MSIPCRVHTYAREQADFAKGGRLLLPVLPVYQRRYSIVTDELHTGWWWFSVSVAIERLGRPAHGISLRFDWGWVRS